MSLSADSLGKIGFGDAPKCDDLARFLNGMAQFAEGGRKADLERFFGLICELGREKVQWTTRMSSLQAEIEAKRSEYCEIKKELSEAIAINEKIVAENKELVNANAQLLQERTMLSGCVEASRAKTDEFLKGLEKFKSEKASLLNENRRLLQRLETIKSGSSSSGPSFANALVCGTSADEDVSMLKSKISNLETERSRLEQLLLGISTAQKEALSKFDAISSKPAGRTRTVPIDEFSKLQRLSAEQQAQIETLTKEALETNHSHSLQMSAKDVGWGASVTGLKAELEKASQRKGKVDTVDRSTSTSDERNTKDLENLLMLGLVTEERDLLRNYVSTFQRQGLLSFMLANGAQMVCPVPTRTGNLMQLCDIYAQWKTYPSENEGTYYSTFTCPYSDRCTTLASSEQVSLIYRIASQLQIAVHPPIQFQYVNSVGVWTSFSFKDQIAIASACCKLYRQGVSSGMEAVAVCNTEYLLVVHLLENSVDFQMQSTVIADVSRQVSAHVGPWNLFDRWTFHGNACA